MREGMPLTLELTCFAKKKFFIVDSTIHRKNTNSPTGLSTNQSSKNSPSSTREKKKKGNLISPSSYFPPSISSVFFSSTILLTRVVLVWYLPLFSVPYEPSSFIHHPSTITTTFILFIFLKLPPSTAAIFGFKDNFNFNFTFIISPETESRGFTFGASSFQQAYLFLLLFFICSLTYQNHHHYSSRDQDRQIHDGWKNSL
jgi:hypothetical protein